MISDRSSFLPGNTRLVALALLSLTLAAGLTVMLILSTSAVPERATVLPSPVPLPEFTLNDHNDQAFTRRSFEDQWSLVFFGFTNCPDICPLTLQQLAYARQRMAEDLAEDKLPEIVFISVDPDRDNTQVIGAYVGAFGRGVTGVNGDLTEINKLTKAFGIFHARTATDDRSYTVEHSAAVIVVNNRAEYHAVFGAPHDVAGIARDMSLLMASR